MVFVSYSRADSDFAINLATDLKNVGLDVWLDQLDIPVGAIWDNEIEAALQNCESVILIISENSVRSNNVLNEVYYALEENKKVLPVKIDGCKKIPFRLTRLHFIDISVNYEKGLKDLLRAFKIGEVKPESSPIPVSDETIIGDSKVEAVTEEKTLSNEKVSLPETEPKVGANEPPVGTPVLENSYENEEALAWEEAMRVNTDEALKRYLQTYPHGIHASDAAETIKSREDQHYEEEIWANAAKANSLSSLQHYLKESKLRTHARDADSLIDEIEKQQSESLAWEEASRADTEESLHHYLQKYPQGAHAEEVTEMIKTHADQRYEEAIWKNAKSDNGIGAFQYYLMESKLRKHVEEANEIIAELEKKQSGHEAEKPTPAFRIDDNLPKGRSKLERGIVVGVLGLLVLIIVIRIFPKNDEIPYTETITTIDSTSTAPVYVDTPKVTPDDKGLSFYNQGLTYYNQKNYAEALPLFQQAADAGSEDAMVYIGYMHEHGQGVTRNYGTAKEWYERAANLGNAQAMCNLGMFYLNGLGVKKDYDSSMFWYQKAANFENASAMTGVGYLYDMGYGVKRNYNTAMEWYQKAANLGNAQAMHNIGASYENGDGVPIDIDEANKWYRKAKEAKKNGN